MTVYAQWGEATAARVTCVNTSEGGNVWVGSEGTETDLVPVGNIVTLIPKAKTGYRLDRIEVTDASGASVPLSGDYTFTMPAENVTVRGVFTEATYRIRTNVIGDGSIVVDGGKTQGNYKEEIRLTAVPRTGAYRKNLKVYLSGDSTRTTTLYRIGSPDEERYCFYMPSEDVTIEARFSTVNMLQVDFGEEHEAYVRRVFGGIDDYDITGSVVTFIIGRNISPEQAYQKFIQSIYTNIGSSLPDDEDTGGKLVKTFGNSGDFALHEREYYSSLTELEAERASSAWKATTSRQIILYALWEMPVEATTLDAVSPACGTNVTYQEHNDTYQSVPVPELSLSSPMRFVDSGTFCTSWRGSGTFTMQGDHEYIAVFHPEPAWGYYIPDGQAPGETITASGDNVRIVSADAGNGNVEIAVKVEHDWGPWQVVREPHGGVDGLRQRVCAGGCVEEEPIPSQHVHQVSRVAQVDPGCEEEGTKEHWICDQGDDPCYLLFKDAGAAVPATEAELAIPATGHRWGVWSVEVPPTCTTTGVETQVCENNTDHANKREIGIDPEAHEWGEWEVTEPATETADGTEQRVCRLNPEHRETRTFRWNHTHSFVYTAGTGDRFNEITAVCEAPGSAGSACSYHEQGITIALNAPVNTEYDGQPKTATVTGYPDTAVQGLAEKPEVAYYRLTYRDGEETPTEARLFEPPTEYGSYAARITWGGAMVDILFEITDERIFSVTVTPSGQGTVSASPESGTAGTQVMLTAVPDEGWQFDGWTVVSGGVTITDNAFTLGTQNVEIKAVFSEIPPAPFEYFAYSGANQDHVKKSGKDAVFVVKRSVDDKVTYSRFLKIRTDGKDVAADDYTCAEGSAVITLKAAWLDTLSVGAHTLGVIFTDGAVDIPFTVSQKDPTPPTVVPHTGDGANPPLWIGLVLLGLLGIAGLAVFGKRE